MFRFSSIEQYHNDLESGSTSCLQAVEHYLSATEKHKHLNAFIEVFASEAIERARLLDEQQEKGALHGVVIGIKDNICYKDHKLSAGSGILQNFTSVFSATVVERLLQQGAIIIGRQNCDEFGMGSTNENSFYGPVLNPSDPSRVAGGSSGGSAAAVAAGLCMASLGSDTGGSVRLPASHCGVVGFKPSYGSVSRHGLVAYASSFDQVGVLAAGAADAEVIFRVIAGADDFDSTVSAKNLFSEAPKEGPYTIGYFPAWLHHASVDPSITSSIKNFIHQLQQQGHTIKELPFDLTEYIVPSYYILTTAEASSNLSRYDGIRYGTKSGAADQDLAGFIKTNRTHGFGSEVRRRIMLGSYVLSAGYYDAYFTKAQQVRQVLIANTDLIFNELDFLISPVSPSFAPIAGEKIKDPLAMYMEDLFTVYANLTGIPAVSLPVLKHSHNLSLGVMIAAAYQNEVSLLRFSHQLMQQ